MQTRKPFKRFNPKPAWLRKRLPTGPEYSAVRRLLREAGLLTVCQEAQCPNIWECFSNATAAFLILGPRCTRNCRFCAVAHGPPAPPDPAEPGRIAAAAAALNLDYVVVTSVTRDDLNDGGAAHFAAVTRAIRNRCPAARVELLVPDFSGDSGALSTVLAAGPDVLNHNLETVQRLYAGVRPEADYTRSLTLLAASRHCAPHITTKSGLMLGLGERPPEIRRAMEDLLSAGCRILTLGQYLQPTPRHLPVADYIRPSVFAGWRRFALAAGFTQVVSGPFVRSSYHAKDVYKETAL